MHGVASTSKTGRLIGAAIMSVVVTAAGLVAVPGVAWANPPGCTKNINFWTSVQGGGLLMHAYGWGSCTTWGTRTLRVEIKNDGWPTDPVVAANSDHHTGTSFDASVASCDGGQTKDYYGRSFYTGYTDFADEGYYEVETCS